MKKLCLLAILFMGACTSSKKIQSVPLSSTIVNGKLFASAFQQRAAEYRALCFQAFNAARNSLDLYHTQSAKPLAIITDIDETVLDNSPYDVRQALEGKDYESASWQNWTATAQADTVPGAPSFLNYAASRGVAIYYITNRDEKERQGTLRNLQKFNLPNADNEHLILRQTSSSKESRRQDVMANHEVVLLLGDNLADFNSVFDKRTVDERNKTTNLVAAEFGKRYIMIPNPVYGDWESALYQYNFRLTPAQKDSVLRSELKSEQR